MYELALFTGCGGGVLGSMLSGYVPVGFVEYESSRKKMLLSRQRDGIFPRCPIWDDVTTFRVDNPECRSYFEIMRRIKMQLMVSMGFPCQDISAANPDGKGLDGKRSGLYEEGIRVIREIRPTRVLIENSPNLINKGLKRILKELTSMGYDAKWGVIPATIAGANHKRCRLFIIANSNKKPRPQAIEIASTIRAQRQTWEDALCSIRGRKSTVSRALHESDIIRKNNDVPDRIHRAKAIGDGQVPGVVKFAHGILN